MAGKTIAGIARYPQPVSSLGHGADRPRGACAQSGIARDGGRDNSGAPVRSLPGLLDAATRWRPVAPDIASAPRDNGSDRERKAGADPGRSEEHTSELQSLMRISYAVFCLKKTKKR